MSGAVTPQAGGDARELAINEAYRNANLWWRSDRGGATIVLLGSRSGEGHTYERGGATRVVHVTLEDQI
jgi:hypothetical protein